MYRACYRMLQSKASEPLTFGRRIGLGALVALLLFSTFGVSFTSPANIQAAETTNSSVVGVQDSVSAVKTGDPVRAVVSPTTQTYAWGYNLDGQLGNGTTTSSTVPIAVTMPTGISSFSSIASLERFNIALDYNGRAYGWGYNDSGELGDGTTTPRSTPVAVVMPSGVTSFNKVEVGVSHSVGLANNGKLYAWGADNLGQLGTGGGGSSNVPVAVTFPSGVTAFTDVAVGAIHNLALGNDGKLYAWGWNGLGQLGNGSITSTNVPVLVTLPSGVTSFTRFAAGGVHSLAFGNDGKLYSWGYNGDGQLGNGTNTGSNIPTLVSLPSGVSAYTNISAGFYHNLATGNDGNLYAWGRNESGQLGNAATTNSNIPVMVTLPSGATSFTNYSAGGYHSLGIVNDDRFFAWGQGTEGQLGNGSTTNSSVPVLVDIPAGKVPVSIRASGGHNVAVFATPGGFHPLPQFRLYDSRAAFGGPGPFALGETRTITAVNNTGIPSNSVTNTVTIPASAKSIVVNFTAVQVSKGGFLTAYQTGITRPTISTLNWYYANQIVANSAVVDLNSAGQFDAYFGASAGDLTVDVIGYIDNQTDGPAIPPTNPLSGVLTTTALTYKPVSSSITNVRAYDSRPAYGGPGPLTTGVTRTVQIRGTAGVPSSAKAVIVNLTAIGAVNRGYLAAYTGNSNPGTASVSFNGSVQPVVGNLVVAYLDSAGAITILAGGTNTSADFVIDVFGYYDNTDLSVGGYVGLAAPVRHYDSRTSQGGAGPISAGTTISAAVSTKLGTTIPTGVPANARAVVIHLAVVNTVSNGFLALYGVNYQGTSSLNWAGNGQLVSNLAVVDLNQLDSLKVKAGGNTAAKADFIIDIVGYIP